MNSATSTGPSSTLERWPERWGYGLFYLIPVLIVGVIFAFRLKTSAAVTLPSLGAVPPLQMLNQNRTSVSAADFRGKVHVVDFFFTSCPVSCPKLTKRMASVQDRLERGGGAFHDVKLTSISVDPENDTPEQLRAYATRFGAHDERWDFLTGPGQDLQSIIVGGFKMEYHEADPALGIVEIMHGNWFVLTDKEAHIRGYYLADSKQQIDRLLEDAAALAAL